MKNQMQNDRNKEYREFPAAEEGTVNRYEASEYELSVSRFAEGKDDLFKKKGFPSDHIPDIESSFFYRIVIRTDQKIYAYEADKQILLRLMDVKTKERGFEVVAFAVLDDELQAIIGCEEWTDAGGRALVKEIAAAYDKYFRDKRGYTGVVKENIGWKSVPSRRMAKACEEVHYLAVERGYASDPADFWWSTTNHYKGRYEWRFLDVCWTMAVKLELMKRFPMKHKSRS